MKSPIPLDEALQELQRSRPQASVEQIDTSRCLGRVLAGPVRLESDIPPFDRATMDGYAIAARGDALAFPVSGTVHAGEQPPAALEPGTALRIMTGAPCPPGVTVVPLERTDGGRERVLVRDAADLSPGRNVARRGEDGRRGDLVLEAGCILSPATIAAAAMAGARSLPVAAQIPVHVVTTGDEVGSAGPAAIQDSNGPFIESFLQACGASVSRVHSSDRADALLDAIEAGAPAPVIATVGGVSMGDRDLVPGAARAAGFVPVFHRVPIQPGKPVYFARHPDGRCLLGLPGNPVSVLVTSHLFLPPLLLPPALLESRGWRFLPLAAPFRNPGERRLFLPARLSGGSVEPVRWNGSGDLLAAASADGLADFPPGFQGGPGDPVPFLPYIHHVPGCRGILPPRQSGRSSRA